MITAEQMQRVLRDVAAQCETPVWRDVQARVARGDRRLAGLAEWVIGEYSDPAKRRWYDPLHIAFSTQFALDLVAAGAADPLIIPAILLHDMGYFAITDKEAWNRPEVRVTHMQEGAALAAEVLARHGYAPADLRRVVGMVATHDNPYLGYPLSGADRLALRDCDRVWVMHCVSFYKDWSSKRAPDPNTNVRRLLAVRRVHFYGEAARGEADWGVDESVWGEAAGRTEIPALAAAQAKIGRLFERRRGELASGVWERGQSGPDSLGAFLLEVVSGE
ncbi:MAG: hypothetical protein U0939_26175 [Pirellulales bacterium]